MSYQYIQRGSHTWEVIRVDPADDGHEFTSLGRVVQEGDLWFAEMIHWQDIGHTWHRLEGTKGWATRKRAYQDITRRGEKQV